MSNFPNNEGPILAPEGPSEVGKGAWVYAPRGGLRVSRSGGTRSGSPGP